MDYATISLIGQCVASSIEVAKDWTPETRLKYEGFVYQHYDDMTRGGNYVGRLCEFGQMVGAPDPPNPFRIGMTGSYPSDLEFGLYFQPIYLWCASQGAKAAAARAARDAEKTAYRTMLVQDPSRFRQELEASMNSDYIAWRGDRQSDKTRMLMDVAQEHAATEREEREREDRERKAKHDRDRMSGAFEQQVAREARRRLADAKFESAVMAKMMELRYT